MYINDVKDMSIQIYARDNVFLDAIIEDDALTVISNVFGIFDSELTYSFSKEQTERLFKLISFEDFIITLREKDIEWMEDYLKENNIKPATFTWVS